MFPSHFAKRSIENPFLKERAAARKKYQSKERKSNHKFEIVRGQELLVRAPLPMAEVRAETQAHVKELTRQAGLPILRAILAIPFWMPGSTKARRYEKL